MTASQSQYSMKVEVGETLVANHRVLKYATGLRTDFEYLLLED